MELLLEPAAEHFIENEIDWMTFPFSVVPAFVNTMIPTRDLDAVVP